MQTIKSLKDKFELLKYASPTGTIKAMKAYMAIRHFDSWVLKDKILPPYPPESLEKNGKIKIVTFKINYHGKRISITGWRFWETFLAIKEVFIEKEYDWLDVSGRKVLDLGAFTGDSAISFAARNAAEVYTCEPNPNMIRIIHYNVENNGFQNNIKVLHLFVGSRSSNKTGFYFDNQNMVNLSDELKLHEIHTKVPTVTLDSLVKKYKIIDGCLKMDIEGAEYACINAASKNTLRRFRQMQIDFHRINGKSYKSIKKKLGNAGFDCEVHFVGTRGGGYINALNTYR